MQPLRKRSIFFAVLAVILAVKLAAPVAAQSCGNYLCVDAHYLNGCVLRVEAHVSEFHGCGVPSPGGLLLRVYRDGPSDPDNPGARKCGEASTGCDSPTNGVFRADLPVWDNPSCATASSFFVEAWLDPPGANQHRVCILQGRQGLPVRAIPPGDDDGDGIDTCADNCPLDVNPLQADTDDNNEEEKGDACDTTIGDLDGDGIVGLLDLDIFRDCTSGAGITDPPAGCDIQHFIGADLDGDGDVDIKDIRAVQVFFTGE